MTGGPPRRRLFEVEDIEDISVINFLDRYVLDDSRSSFQIDLKRLVDELGRHKLLLNLANAEFPSNGAFPFLINLHRKLRALNGKLALYNVPKKIMEVISITKLDKLLTIITDPELVCLGDVFDYVFRLDSFSADWRTSTVVALARSMYESRDFSTMPILSDALQDAGCENENILNHCRGPGPHVRGCLGG